MVAWIRGNVPEDAAIATTLDYSRQLIFQDARQHEWSSVRESPFTRSKLLGAAACTDAPSSDKQCPLPRQLVELEVSNNCNARGISVAGLLRQLRQSRASYLVLTGESVTWMHPLTQSGAFDVVHTSHLKNTQARVPIGLALLKRTGQEAMPAPVVMSATTLDNLVRCMRQAPGGDYRAAIRAAFPHRIRVIGSASRVAAGTKVLREVYADR